MHRTTVTFLCVLSAAAGAIGLGGGATEGMPGAPIAGVLLALVAAGIARGRGAERPLATHAALAYELFVDVWSRRLSPPGPLGALDRDLTDDFRLLDRALALYGSRAVVGTHARMRRDLADGMAPAALRVRLEMAINELRRDLGSGGRLRTRELRHILNAPAQAATRLPGAPATEPGPHHHAAAAAVPRGIDPRSLVSISLQRES